MIRFLFFLLYLSLLSIRIYSLFVCNHYSSFFFCFLYSSVIFVRLYSLYMLLLYSSVIFVCHYSLFVFILYLSSFFICLFSVHISLYSFFVFTLYSCCLMKTVTLSLGSLARFKQRILSCKNFFFSRKAKSFFFFFAFCLFRTLHQQSVPCCPLAGLSWISLKIEIFLQLK
jgi:hypothetical protein